jgi:hypothetical protein
MSELAQSIEQAVVEQLQKVIDPETGADVWHMCMVENLIVDENGHTSVLVSQMVDKLVFPDDAHYMSQTRLANSFGDRPGIGRP